jgi:tetratricopeptide (TPR) repeat protein
MKSLQMTGACVFAILLSCLMGIAAPANSDATSNEVWSVFERFVKEKHVLAERLAKQHKVEVPARVEDFFRAAQKRDWVASSNFFHAIQAGAGKRTQTNTTPEKKWMPSELWDPVLDAYGAFELFHAMNPKFVKMYGADIVKDVPAGSIYFGGNDPGYFLVAAFSESHSEGRPFFTLSQNRLVDSGYLAYVADMYGDKIKFVGTNDTQSASESYSADWQRRSLHDKNFPGEPRQIKPGEGVDFDESGKLRVKSQLGVVAIYGRLAKTVFDINPTREFFVNESFPLDWMFPHLTPSGLIMKINRAEVPELSEDILKQDHEFWARYSERLVGNWITYDTQVRQVAEFVERVYLRHDYTGFQGDADFIRDAAAQKAFSKMRSSIGGIYSWRLGQSPSGESVPGAYIATGENGKLIEREADFAFKQAFAFCPASPEAVYRYVQLLVTAGRVGDALLVAETAQKLDPENTQFGYLIKNLKAIKSQSTGPMDLEKDIARLKNAVETDPTNVMHQFQLAQKYVQAGRNQAAYEILDGILQSPNVTLPQVMSVADAYNRLNQPAKLEAAFEKMTELVPDSPEAWYDLAASHASRGQTAPALEALKKSLDLNSKRLAREANAADVRTTLARDPRFARLRDTAEFKALIAPQ